MIYFQELISVSNLFHISRLKEHSDVLYPSHWTKDFTGSKIQVSNEALKKLEQDFKQSIKKPAEVLEITEICNRDFFERYERSAYCVTVFVLYCRTGIFS